jgi:hypothetical protein
MRAISIARNIFLSVTTSVKRAAVDPDAIIGVAIKMISLVHIINRLV